MTIEQLLQLATKWDLENDSDSVDAASHYDRILDRLQWFGEKEWGQYLPAQHPRHSARYMDRLAAWVGNVEHDSERKLLLEYALHIAFFSHEDFCTLYRSAFTGVVTRWVIELESLSLENEQFQEEVREELHQRTWYCPVTDSMDVNEFYHANHIVGAPYRPALSLLNMLDEPAQGEGTEVKSRLLKNLETYIKNPNPGAKAPSLKRLVLLEDFVGSGSQCISALKWAAKNLQVPILFVPLVICAPGIDELARISKEHPDKVWIKPLLILGERDLLGPKRNNQTGIPNAKAIEALALAKFEQVAGGKHSDRRIAPYTAFGFRETGASFVSYSNTPNNSLPLIHHSPKSGTWQPLFPRSARI